MPGYGSKEPGSVIGYQLRRWRATPSGRAILRGMEHDPEAYAAFAEAMRGEEGTLLVAGAVAPMVRFGFVCPRSWEELAATERGDVRACDACRQPVYRCETVEEADERARRGECISVPARLVEAHADRRTMIVGRPEPAHARWARKLFG